jgi:DNA-binding MarR family transcriptional regulator
VQVTLSREGRRRVDAALTDLLAQERAILATLPSADRDRLADLLRLLTIPFEHAYE